MLLQLAANLMMVENFAIEGDGHVSIRAEQRLVATGHV